ncbi:type II secretion system F family protein [Sphingomonas oryzagri]|jgi:tight adherence protein B|uniref:Type II secretion system F family protein n=1 Tax=Sphingomonas oryzagri TaxID=3042314 RepID=A0ABT6MXV9_9SPHN|nr:type II secretion system F family protein [Sphingomonas oryzagri]MDH7637324.1 type II secretion system F family protein [Sphingomonas oryzagri]
MASLLIRLVILIVVFLTVFLLSSVIGGAIANRRAESGAVNKRLKLLKAGVGREAIGERLLKNTPPVLSPGAPLWQRVYVNTLRMIMMSGIPIAARAVFVGIAAAAGGLLVLFLLIALSAGVQLTLGVIELVALLAVAIGIAVPLMIVSRFAQKRRKRMEQQFPNTLDIFVRSLRAGHPVAAAIELITKEMQDPVGSEFGLVADEVSYGADINDALAGMAERWDMEDIRMFVVSVSVQSETGGNLAEILDNLSRVIRDRAAMYMKVRALSSEGRMTGWMLSVLPVLAFVGLFATRPAFYLDVAQDPIFTVGVAILLSLYVFGVLMIRRMIDLKV